MPAGCSPLKVCRIFFVLAATLFLLSQGILSAAEADSLEDLKARMAALERQNQRLLKTVEQRRSLSETELDDATGVLPADYETDPSEIFTDEVGGDARIRSVIKEYLAEQEAKKKAAEAQKSAEATTIPEVGSDLSMHATWKNGLDLGTKNKDFRVHVGGRTHFDSSWFNADGEVQSDPTIVNRIRDGVDFRRARLRIDGTMYEQIEWVVEYDFFNSALALPSASGSPATLGFPAPTDLFWTFIKLPYVGNFRVGNQKEPIGFEHLVSSRFQPFIERSFNHDSFYGAFNNGFTPGISVFNSVCEERVTWAIGAFKPTLNVFAFNTGGGEYSVTGRLAGLPWYVDEGRRLLHLGVSARQSGMDDGLARYRTRGPERSGLSAVWPLFADSGAINGSGQQMVNFETATNLGSLTIQAEYLLNYVQSAFRTGGPQVGTLFYHGGYVEALYFLTGEHREYNRKNGWFDRVVPTENAHFSCSGCDLRRGRGAWQIGLRYNHLDLNNKGINGGRLNDLTFAVNWFLNPNMKVQWDYSITERDSPLAGHDGLIQGFGIRLAHDF